MPNVVVKKDLLFEKIGHSYTDEEFDKLCFEFGIELDEVVTDGPDGVEYKIDIPANRYDLLCVEGIATALAVFTGRAEPPNYTKEVPKDGGPMITTTVSSSTAKLRPYVVTAVLRNVTLTQEAYQSMIDLQEKLHHNICRKRTLVAIGVHDLDTLTPPFTYSCEPPEQIKFLPLNQEKGVVASELMEYYASDTHIKPYLHILEGCSAYPVIRDSTGLVLSLPPIINGNHSKVGTSTRNIFIEATATDLSKAHTVLDTLVAMLSLYVDGNPGHVEITKVIYEDGELKEDLCPKLLKRQETLDVDVVNGTVGINISADTMANSLSRMGLSSKAMTENEISVEIPPTRHDIIHPCDIIEDVAIAYGYSNIVSVLPPTATIGGQNPLNKLCSQLANSIAQAGFTETLTFALCSVEDECEKMLQPRGIKESQLVRISNPKSQDFQVARSSLLPGLLKTVQANKSVRLPLKLFEFSDVVHLEGSDTGARNCRHFCALYTNKTPGFEVIHGLLDKLMELLEVKFEEDYHLEAGTDPSYFPGRCAEVIYKNKVIGRMGVVHPGVLKNFELTMPCSAIEIEIEPFL